MGFDFNMKVVELFIIFPYQYFHCASFCLPHFPRLFVFVSHFVFFFPASFQCIYFVRSVLFFVLVCPFYVFSVVLWSGFPILSFICLASFWPAYYLFSLMPCFILMCLFCVFSVVLHSSIPAFCFPFGLHSLHLFLSHASLRLSP